MVWRVNAGWGTVQARPSFRARRCASPRNDAEARSPSGLLPGARVVPKLGAIVVEDECRILRHGDPNAMRQFVVELRRRPARITERGETFARTLAETDVRSSPSSAKTASERIVRIVVRDQPRLRERRAAEARLVGPEIPIRPARIATRREGIVHVAAIADRHFGSGIEVGARLNRDHRGGAVGMMDDRARRLDDGAGRGTINRRLVFLR